MINRLPNPDFWRNKKVLVTGHSGFKGGWLTIWLDKLEAIVSGISLEAQTCPNLFTEANISEICESKFVDITNLESLSKEIHNIQPEIIIHMAAQSLVRKSYEEPINTFNVNVLGSLNILEAVRECSSVKTVIMVTTDKVYQNNEGGRSYKEDDSLGGHDPYSSSKAASEIVIESYRKSFFSKENISISSARAGNVIGGGDWSDDRLIPDAVKSWKANKTLEIRSPNSVRPWQHVLEPLSGYLNLALSLKDNKLICGEPFNFGPLASENKSVREVVSLMADRWQTSNWKIVEDTMSSNKEHNLLQLNCEKAAIKLGWHPVWYLEDTINNTIDWYRSFYENGAETIIELTGEQIDQYTIAASERGLEWTR